MEISCPSCSRAHRTEDHPGAFEIQCACGYSILVPDEAQFDLHPINENLTEEAEVPLHNFEQAPAALVESEAESIAMPQNTPEGEVVSSGSSENTNIGGLPYDPFLIEQGSHEAQIETSVESAEAADRLHQSIAGRVFLAHLGQPESTTFHLKLSGIEDASADRLKKKLDAFLKARPWLGNRLLELGVSLDQIQNGEVEWTQVPEIFAVEVYLSAFEVGARCEVME